MARTHGRKGRPWERIRDEVIRRAFSPGGDNTCKRCHQAIDLPGTWPARHPLSLSVDHIVPLSKGGRGNDSANLRLMHFGCNSGRGDGTREKVRRTW